MRKLTHEEIARRRFSSIELKSMKRAPMYAMLDNIRSLYNVGSIFRTSDGARVSKLLLCGYTPHPPRKEIEKTALGATATVPWEYYQDPMSAISEMKSLGISICVLEHADTSVPYYTLTPNDFPLCIVVGNEITGVSSELVAQADFAVDIPMIGMKQSLNAAVAYGIVAFEFMRILRRGEGSAERHNQPDAARTTHRIKPLHR